MARRNVQGPAVERLFDALTPSILQRRAPPGYLVRRREALPGHTLRETDELVEAAGGWREGEPRARPRVDRVPADDWYVIPARAARRTAENA
jgi:hypothetical protein